MNAIFLFERSTWQYQLSSWTHSNVAGTHLFTKATTSSHTLASATGGSTWNCLVVPCCAWEYPAAVPPSTWQCLVVPDRTCLQYTWHCLAIEFLFHSFPFLVIIHKIVMKLSNTYVGWKKGGVWIITISERMVHYGCHVFIIKDLISLIIVRFDRKWKWLHLN